MNIVLLIGRFPPHDVGGAERQADRLAARLAERGHAVTVITRRWPGRAARETRDGFTIVRTPIALGGPPRSAVDAVATLGAIRGLTPRPDVVLAFQTYISGAIAGLANALFGIPSVVWVRGENEYRFDRSPYLARLANFAWQRARAVLVQTESHRSALLAALSAQSTVAVARLEPRIAVLGNGVDTDVPMLEPGSDWLFVGRLIANKGIDVLLEALSRVPQEARRPLWIVGDGSDRKRLEARARNLGVEARFEGFRERAVLSGYYARSRAIILPSLQGEGLPNALLEAMAYGVPSIASDLPGVCELVSDSGLLVPPGDAPALGNALVKLCDPALQARFACKARMRAKEYSWSGVVERLEGILESEPEITMMASARR